MNQFDFMEKFRQQWNEIEERVGTTSDPVVLPWPWESTSMFLLQRLEHAHDRHGQCRKNRFGYPCKGE